MVLKVHRHHNINAVIHVDVSSRNLHYINGNEIISTECMVSSWKQQTKEALKNFLERSAYDLLVDRLFTPLAIEPHTTRTSPRRGNLVGSRTRKRETNLQPVR